MLTEPCEVLVEQQAQDLGHPDGRGPNVMGLGLFKEGPHPAAVFGWTGPPSAGAARVNPAGIEGPDLLNTQIESPAVDEVGVR